VNHNPYPGLRPFQAKDHRLFFGRETQVDELLDLLQENHFVAVVGVSGSGKSSLVRAGLVPRLRRGFISEAGTSWRIVLVRPGASPLSALWEGLSRQLISSSCPSEGLVRLSQIYELSSRSLIEIAKNFLTKNGEGEDFNENLLLIIDQFEELFTFSPSCEHASSESVSSNEERFEAARAFVDRLMKATQQREVPIYVILTMRSDYLGDCARFRDFPELLNRSQYLIPRMSVQELSNAIEKPAKLGEPSTRVGRPLVNHLLNDLNDEPRNLPRLQHVLMQTWETWAKRFSTNVERKLSPQETKDASAFAESVNRRDDDCLSLVDYEQVGEFENALNKHADDLFKNLDDEDQRYLTELIFKRITTRDTSNRLVRRPTKLSDIFAVLGVQNDAEREKVIRILSLYMAENVSFLTSPDLEKGEISDLTADSMIDLTHESLISGWKALRSWVEAEAESAEQYRRTAQGARDHKVGRRGWLQAGELQYINEFRLNPCAPWTQAWSSRYDTLENGIQISDWARVVAFIASSEDNLHSQAELEERLEKAKRELENRAERAEIESKKLALERDQKEAEKHEAENRAKKAELETQKVALERDQKIATARLRSKILATVLVYVTIMTPLTACVLYLLITLYNRQDADYVANQSAAQFRRLGAASQENAALLAIQSIGIKKVPSNTDVSTWESFERITKGAPAKPLLMERLASMFVVPTKLADGIRSYRVVTLSEPGQQGSAHPRSFQFQNDSLKEDVHFLERDHELFTAVSASGRFAAYPCNAKEPGKAKIVELLNPKDIVFSIPCRGYIRAIYDSAGSDRLVTLEYSDPKQKEVLGTLSVWELHSTSLLYRPKNPIEVMGVALSPGGRYMALALRPSGETQAALAPNSEATVELWSLDPPNLAIKPPIPNVSSFAPIAFSKDGSFLAIGGADGTVMLWKHEIDQQRNVWVNITTVGSDEAKQSKRVDGPRSDPNQCEKYIYKQPLTIRPHFSPVTAVAFGHQSNLLAAAGLDRKVRVVDLDSSWGPCGPTTLWSDTFGLAASQLVFSGKDKFLGLALGENTARVKYALNGIETARVTHKGRVRAIDFSPLEDVAFSVAQPDAPPQENSTSPSRAAEVFSFKTEKAPYPQTLEPDCPNPQHVSISESGPENSLLLAASCQIADAKEQTSVVRVFKLEKFGKVDQKADLLVESNRATPQLPDAPINISCQVAVSDNGEWSISVCDNQFIALVDRTGKVDKLQLKEIDGFRNSPNVNSTNQTACTERIISLTLNHDGSMLGLGNDCGRVAIYQLYNRQWGKRVFDSSDVNDIISRSAEIKILPNTRQNTTAIAFSQNSSTIAAGTEYGVFWMLDLSQPKKVFSTRYEGAIGTIRFGPSKAEGSDSLKVMVASGGVIHTLSVENRQELTRLSLKSQAAAAAFSPDGNRAALGTADGSVSIFDSEPDFLARINYWTGLLHDIKTPPLAPIRATMLGTPGWIIPPGTDSDDSKDGSKKILVIHSLEAGGWMIGANEARLLDRLDQPGQPPPRLSLIKRNEDVFSDDARKSICDNLRSDLDDTSLPPFKKVCRF
jgi:WD40 repeat protein